VLSAPVVVGRRVLGHVSELVLDRKLEHLVGYEVELESGRTRFLPAGVSSPGPDGIEAASALHLVDPEYYRANGITLADAPEPRPIVIDLDSGDVVARG
jgi:hypothetical protein